MTKLVAVSNFDTLVLIDLKIGRFGAGANALGSPTAALELMADKA